MFLHPVLRLFPDFETPSVVVLEPLKKECMYAEIYELHGIPAAAMPEGIGTSALSFRTIRTNATGKFCDV